MCENWGPAPAGAWCPGQRPHISAVSTVLREAFFAARQARLVGLTLRDPSVPTWHDCRRLADGAPYLALYELEGSLVGTSDAFSKDSPAVCLSKERLPPKGSPW